MNIVDFFNKQNEKIVRESATNIVEDTKVLREVRLGRYQGHRNTFKERFTENIIAEFIGVIVKKATPLGEEFKEEFKAEIHKRAAEIVKETVDIKSMINNPETAIQKMVVAFGESKAIDVLRETAKNAVPTDMDLDKMDKAELSKEDKLEVEDLANRLHGDDIADIINTKTIEVINDESERAAKRQEDLENIKTETAPEGEEPETSEDDETPTGDEEEIEESLFGKLHKRSAMQSIKESTDGRIANTAMAEAIMEYVTYETLHTLKFIQLDSKALKELMENKIK